MVEVSILDKTYTVRNNWQDNTVKHLVKAQEYLESLPKWLENYIYSDKPEPVSESKLLKFYIDWIELFSDIPREFLESEIEVNNVDEVSIIDLFKMVAKFLGEPSQEEINISDTITLGKTEYKLIESVKTPEGIKKMLSGATFKHFAEAQAFTSLFQEGKIKKWKHLAKITAILFRESSTELYDEDLIDIRAKAFMNLPISEVYKGCFFLQELMSKLQKSLVTYSMEKLRSQQTRKVSLLSKVCTGILKPIKLLKRVFSTKKD